MGFGYHRMGCGPGGCSPLVGPCGPDPGRYGPCPIGPRSNYYRPATSCSPGCGQGLLNIPNPHQKRNCGMYTINGRCYIAPPTNPNAYPVPPAEGKACWRRLGPKRFNNSCRLCAVISRIDFQSPSNIASYHRHIPFNPFGPSFPNK